jgi:hypothetical protein
MQWLPPEQRAEEMAVIKRFREAVRSATTPTFHRRFAAALGRAFTQ